MRHSLQMELVQQYIHLNLKLLLILSSSLNLVNLTYCRFNQIRRERLTVVSQACSFEVDVNANSLNQSHDQKQPY